MYDEELNELGIEISELVESLFWNIARLIRIFII